jgi:ribosomal-protein-alanine N-acetyltransferase
MERIASKLAAASPVLREYCASTDASGVAGILGDSPEAAQWSPPTEAEMSGSGLVHILVSEAGELESAFQLVGYISARQVADEGEILNLAVRRSWRRRGAGAQLLRGMLRRLLQNQVTRVYLEVRESNQPAISLYEKHGFQRTGRRRGYYRDPAEDALLFERKLPADDALPGHEC